MERTDREMSPFFVSPSVGATRSDAPGTVQIGFSTADPEDKVASYYLDRLRARGKPSDLRKSAACAPFKNLPPR